MNDAFNDTVANLFHQAAHKGWLQPGLDPRGVLMVLHALVQGRVVDDISTQPLDRGAWLSIVLHVVNAAFIAKD